MARDTAYVKARRNAHEHLLRGLDIAKQQFGGVPLGHSVIDARTMQNRNALGSMGDVIGETAGIPGSDHVYAKPVKKHKSGKPVQSKKNQEAGRIVDPGAIETATAGDQTSIDTMGGYGITDFPVMPGGQ